MSIRILVIEDEPLLREDLGSLVTQEGFACDTAATVAEALERLRERAADVIVTDVVLPDGSGIEAIDRFRALAPGATILVMTAFGTMESAIDAFRRGAADFVLKPVVPQDLLARIRRVAEHRALVRRVAGLRRELQAAREIAVPTGASEAMRRVIELADRVAPTGSNVLLTGESGTGKEVIARYIHDTSGRGDDPFVAVNCSGLKETLLESELFGHVRGAFTGAVDDKPGLFAVAGEGTVFLDEIGDVPLALQARLLRALEQREFYPVGGTRVEPLRARIVCATNRDLRERIQRGEFREDLYYRIAVFDIHVPPLRERREDIPRLADYFLDRLGAQLGRRDLSLSADALTRLMAYDWPGNVRELRNVLERAAILSRSDTIEPAALPAEIRGEGSPGAGGPGGATTLRRAVAQFEQALIRRTIAECGGNKEAAARRLGVNPSTLYRKLSGAAEGE